MLHELKNSCLSRCFYCSVWALQRHILLSLLVCLPTDPTNKKVLSNAVVLVFSLHAPGWSWSLLKTSFHREIAISESSICTHTDRNIWSTVAAVGAEMGFVNASLSSGDHCTATLLNSRANRALRKGSCWFTGL